MAKQISSRILEKFLKIYTIVVTIFIVLAAIFAVYYFFVEKVMLAYYLAFVAILFGFILFVTRRFIKRNLQHPKK